MPGPWTIQFAPGPPLHHPSLGLLPGPPAALLPTTPGEPVLLVDDRNAGEDLRQGPHEVHLISTAEALALLAAAQPDTGALDDADIERPITRWKDAAAVLGVSTDTLARRRKERDPQRRCYFEDEDDLTDWWRGLLAPAPAPSPRPRRPPHRATGGPVDFAAVARELTRE
jgi:hypothetical protein